MLSHRKWSLWSHCGESRISSSSSAWLGCPSLLLDLDEALALDHLQSELVHILIMHLIWVAALAAALTFLWRELGVIPRNYLVFAYLRILINSRYAQLRWPCGRGFHQSTPWLLAWARIFL